MGKCKNCGSKSTSKPKKVSKSSYVPKSVKGASGKTWKILDFGKK